jgi:Kef-type K+ transport system membrane component KefB
MTPTVTTPAAPSGRRNWLAAAAYFGMLAGAVGLFLWFRSIGEGLTAPDAPPAAVSVAAPKAGRVDVVAHVLATLAAVIALGYALGRLLARVGQPPVIGEILAGIFLGPSLLGAISPDAMHLLFPGKDADPHGQVVSALKAVAQLGVVLYIFLVGLELNAAKLRHHAQAAVAISHTSIVFPFVLGAGLALWLYPHLSHNKVPFTSFALFMGATLAVTAFPVLARILHDRGLDRTEAGTVALGCAAADDVTAWCLLAFVVGVAQAQVGGAAATAVGAVLFIAGMFLVVRPVAGWVCRKLEHPGPLPAAAVPVLFVAVLLSALATEAIGVHAVFGAFLLGVMIPHESRLAREVTRRLKDVVTVLFLPAFFALTGMKTQVGLLAGWEAWLFCGAIILVATLGKFGGTVAAARLTGHGWRESAALGAMMNTRGLMGLIVLDIGLDMGVISPTLFSMMVLMALVTTMATSPALSVLLPAHPAAPPAE